MQNEPNPAHLHNDWGDSNAHDRERVRLLHHAHADHIESIYRAMSSVPGNPAGIEIQQIGTVRTFVARGDRLATRAIFTGGETPDEIDAVLRHFAAHAVKCVIEVNPANFYVDPPTRWDKPLLGHLMSRGCHIDDFRCVWSAAREYVVDL